MVFLALDDMPPKFHYQIRSGSASTLRLKKVFFFDDFGDQDFFFARLGQARLQQGL
jgi:hypothetical protein